MLPLQGFQHESHRTEARYTGHSRNSAGMRLTKTATAAIGAVSARRMCGPSCNRPAPAKASSSPAANPPSARTTTVHAALAGGATSSMGLPARSAPVRPAGRLSRPTRDRGDFGESRARSGSRALLLARDLAQTFDRPFRLRGIPLDDTATGANGRDARNAGLPVHATMTVLERSRLGAACTRELDLGARAQVRLRLIARREGQPTRFDRVDLVPAPSAGAVGGGDVLADSRRHVGGDARRRR